MRFRTEIETFRADSIGPDDSILFLGSCFADNMGARLREYGFDVTHNPLGPLFNPASIAAALGRAMERRSYVAADFMEHDGIYHAMDWAARYQSPSAGVLAEAVNRDFTTLCEALERARIIFITFGTAYAYHINGSGAIAGNCHKLPASTFHRSILSIDDVCRMWRPLLQRLREAGKRVILTVSPVRHVADGLHGNNISKATLLLATEALETEYFPAYEILCDDLRDHRFYAADLKHPSDTAIDYIYEKFADTYFSAATKETIRGRYAAFLRAAHRPGNNTL